MQNRVINRKTLSMFLVLVMALLSFPLTSFAAPVTEITDTGGIGMKIVFATATEITSQSFSVVKTDNPTDVPEEYTTVTKKYEVTIVGFAKGDIGGVKLPAADAAAWVYDDNFVNGGLVGMGKDSLPFREAYYLSSSELIKDTPVINNPPADDYEEEEEDDNDNNGRYNDRDDDDDDDDDDYRYNGGSSGGSGVSRVDSTPTPVTSANATTSVTNAIQAAQQSGSENATARLTNPGEISLSVMQDMTQQAGDTSLKVNADSVVGNEVDVRITLDPSQATSDLDLSASTVNATAVSVENQFERFFTNDVMTVALGQSGSFGMSVQIAAKVADGLDTTTLVFYAYDRASNTYNRIAAPAYWVDANGYVHFSTSVGGSIIISDGELRK